MKAFIRKIVLFSSTGAMRDVPLSDGLNIVTGDSKTGKSALIEIVDYCLFSSRSTIPVGKITEFTELFCIILQLSKKFLVIARPKWGSDQTKAYLSIETNEFFLDTFSIEYFKGKTRRALKAVQVDVEEHLGLSVLDTREKSQSDKRSSGKATMRSFISFLFQHQNLIANKHVIFYRFDDFYKRKNTVDQFPILMGWVDGEYYSIKQQLEEKKKLLRKETRRQKSLKLDTKEQIEKLRTPINQYYTAIGYVLEKDLSLRDLKKRAQSLPEISRTSYEDSNVDFQSINLKDKLKIYRRELSDVIVLIKQISKNSNDANNYQHKLQHIVEANTIKDGVSELICPFCHSATPEIEEVINSVNDSRDELISELVNIGNYKTDSSEHIKELIEKRDVLKNDIRLLAIEIKNIESTIKEIKLNNELRDGLQFLKGVIQVTLDQILSKPTLDQNPIDFDELKGDIETLQGIIDGYNLEEKYQDANSFISRRMTEISKTLDFEEELQPGTMRFDLKNFDFYYNFERKDIRLSEMGSGANWLACHLSLFLSLLHLSCKEKASCIPSVLFIDQPSQVYFPKATKTLSEERKILKEATKTLSKEKKILKEDTDLQEADENIIQVKNIFTVILNELAAIKKDCNFLPQIVVMEHADEIEFNEYVKKRWVTDGDKLI
ncbi:AAA domain-containing protein [Candidatus Electrothrix aarhusensis]|uniref:AAA domain-containing protein n=1 Tax=Candidatus Electrothrix aarhusensis TaxID=1859131 RepID=A0A444IR38_9BACT|nr:AAA domain-containing protein [Candidatus Electrothrix aarhusensis]